MECLCRYRSVGRRLNECFRAGCVVVCVRGKNEADEEARGMLTYDVSSDLGETVIHIDDLQLGVRVHVQTRYGTKVGEGSVSQILAPLVWIGEAIYSADDCVFTTACGDERCTAT